MNGFQTQTTSPATTAPDPHKHVKYSLGMVLGVDDFDQEFAYLSNRDQWLARDTIGYGTVCGLKVSIETDERGPRVAVEPGVAINPRGQLMRVTPAQCAYLNDWLDAHREDVIRELGSPPADQLTLYVVLCYRECPTDPVPIPGEPCRDETEATVNSRLQDDFQLALSFSPPDQTEENAVRDFVEWMSHIEISDGATSLSLDDFLAAIRDGAQLSSPPSPPTDFMYGSPPEGIVINAADACEYLRAALRVWVTELRPLWRGAACDGSTPDEDCVLLAQLDVPLVDGLASSDEAVVVNEEQRPFLVHLRMLQEWLTCGPHAMGGGSSITPASAVIDETTFGQASSVGTLVNQYALADHTHGTPPLPPGAEPGDTVVSETAFGQAASAGEAAQYSRADHTHGTPPQPPAAQPGNTVVSETTFGRAAVAGSSTQYSRADHTHGTPLLTGDVTATPGRLTVVGGIGQIPIDLTNLDDGEVLIFNKTQGRWLPGPTGGNAAGDFVEHPAGLPRYLIVAAGIVKFDPPVRSPVYNNLKIIGFPNVGVVACTFDTYNQPHLADDHQYIVKVLPIFNPEIKNETQGVFAISILRFEKDGFYLWVTDLVGRPTDPGLLRSMEFMIEVSEYRAKVGAAVRPRVDLNTATADELRTLPRVGPALANRIVAARRKTRGGFKTLDDVAAVDGIGADTLRIIEPFVTLSHK
jgi:competence ComEA-like helix-hairpin-helix protein